MKTYEADPARETPTPRTDAEKYDTGLRLSRGDKEPHYVVNADFARTLERQLQHVSDERERLERENAQLRLELETGRLLVAAANRDMEKLREELEAVKAERDKLRSLFRTDKNRLHIRMSWGDLHSAKEISDLQIQQANEKIRLIELTAGDMFYGLAKKREEESQRPTEHKPDCAWHPDMPSTCTCGLAELLK